jgi:uncharacterized membrane protein YeaQ/YmgE (transglycosylase-associated protein family)
MRSSGYSSRMEVVAGIAALLAGGFVVGGLARFALPGPDPLPVWLTMILGVAGSVVGVGSVGLAGGLYGDEADIAWIAFVAALAGATVLLAVFRRVVQKRPVTGPGAQRRPRKPRGLRRVILRRPPRELDEPEEAIVDGRDPLERLVALRDAGKISEAEFEKRRAAFSDDRV